MTVLYFERRADQQTSRLSAWSEAKFTYIFTQICHSVRKHTFFGIFQNSLNRVLTFELVPEDDFVRDLVLKENCKLYQFLLISHLSTAKARGGVFPISLF